MFSPVDKISYSYHNGLSYHVHSGNALSPWHICATKTKLLRRRAKFLTVARSNAAPTHAHSLSSTTRSHTALDVEVSSMMTKLTKIN